MKNFSWKQLLPHLIAIGIFLVVALIYCRPALEGKVLQQSDIIQWQGMSKDAFNYREKHDGNFPLWINNMFSGMPSFQVAATYNNMLPSYIISILSLYLPKPVHFFFLACICFYFLLQVLRVNTVVSIMGALGFAYATYNPIIISVGHDTKMLSIAFMPAMLGSLLLIYEKRYWLGAGLTALSTSLMIAANHPQIAYYTFLALLAVTIAYVIRWVRNKEYKHLVLAAAITVVSGGIGFLVNASQVFTTYDFSKATIRGGSALSTESNKEQSGLSREYALNYSMYKSEPLEMMFPKFYGGSSDHEEKAQEDSKAIEALSAMPQQLQQQVQGFYRPYWGGIGSTSGPAYLGAVICFLAIMGMFVLDGKHKWWIAAITLITVVMSWGSYFMSLNGWLLDHLPLYNKFRAPSMILVVPQLVLPLLACLALDKLLSYPTLKNSQQLEKQFRKGLIGVAAVIALGFLVYLTADFYSENDKTVLAQVRDIPQTEVKEPIMAFFNGLKADRQSLMMGSILRALLLSLAAAGLLYAYFKNKLKPLHLGIAFTLLAFIDLISVDSKYLGSENYQDKEEYANNFKPSAADAAILQDKGFYRVFNTVNGSPFTDAMTSYFHHSVGGYNPARLSIYEDLIQHQLSKSPLNLAVFSMLNTKYFIVGNPASPQVQQNPEALGNAWFVKTVKQVNGPAEEMKALDHFTPRDTAIVDKKYASMVKFDEGVADSAAAIKLVKNDNDYIEYSSNNSRNGFGVFSEIFYDRGWKAFIDNKETPIAKVNYVLRGLSIPAGQHKIEFKFDPPVYKTGSRVTAVCQVLLLILLIGSFIMDWRRKKTSQQTA